MGIAIGIILAVIVLTLIKIRLSQLTIANSINFYLARSGDKHLTLNMDNLYALNHNIEVLKSVVIRHSAIKHGEEFFAYLENLHGAVKEVIADKNFLKDISDDPDQIPIDKSRQHLKYTFEIMESKNKIESFREKFI